MTLANRYGAWCERGHPGRRRPDNLFLAFVDPVARPLRIPREVLTIAWQYAESLRQTQHLVAHERGGLL